MNKNRAQKLLDCKNSDTLEMNSVSMAQLKGKGWLQAIKHQIQTNLVQLRDGDSKKRIKCYVSHMFSLFEVFVSRCQSYNVTGTQIQIS
jgi:hypothetical protein